MDMYSKCGSHEDAWKIFESAQETDEVSMTVMLVGLAQNGQEEEAIYFFIRMRFKMFLESRLSIIPWV